MTKTGITERTFIFVDCMDTFWLPGGRRLNPGLIEALDQAAEAGHKIVLMTMGDVVEYQEKLADVADMLPPYLATSWRGGPPRLEKKSDLKKFPLPIVIDDTPLDRLPITADYYISAANRTDAAYYVEALSRVLGPLPPRAGASPPVTEAPLHPG